MTDARKGKSIVRQRKTEPSGNRRYDYTIDQAFELFLSLKKAEGVRPRTFGEYAPMMRQFRKWLDHEFPGTTLVNDISTCIVRSYIVYLREEHVNERSGETGLSPYTVNVRIRFLKVFFNAMFREEIIDTNPMNNVKLMKVDEDTFDPLTDEEVERLLAVPNTKEYAQWRDLTIMYLILDTGMRVAEVCGLEVSEIDFKSRTITLPASKNKNRKPRVLPLSNTVAKMLFELVTESRAYFNSEYVFLTNAGLQYHPDTFRRRLHMYKEKAGIEKKVTPHGLRHLWTRNFLMNGGNLYIAQRILGHQCLSTTRRYFQMTEEDLKEQHAQFSPIMRLRAGKRR
ncbi:tyrosine-type recombinase/integrase [Brevibacillus borstelensis]|uniref:tyrosine-type recombinase/integrase n=1 Tax=Brevibacillus borstelensis TaxID=45462 RepID=UPI00046A50B8|nr:tyrosine-type recombinase/integrase [Brevibacillus borstelensis]MCC0566533.1 tyrosine-type recombinase/integrase [Brevibacillus borstelensis]MCM3473071.1 tyrosine-type recombinase/integrase [Brevibacillus borstelensis]MCM3561782.1 tyrosine-type recombinase/integrase [Brevibacillus borstelensis]MED1852999.1 tyrosine-type recombinase/integrase [Brevibacillus borstelensis]